MDSGFGDDEAYNVYDKAWRSNEGLSQNIYRPSRNQDHDIYGDDLDKLMKTSRFELFTLNSPNNFSHLEISENFSKFQIRTR